MCVCVRRWNFCFSIQYVTVKQSTFGFYNIYGETFMVFYGEKHKIVVKHPGLYLERRLIRNYLFSVRRKSEENEKQNRREWVTVYCINMSN